MNRKLSRNTLDWSIALAALAAASLWPARPAVAGDDVPEKPAAGKTTGDVCLVAAAENITNGGGNWYAYVQIATPRYRFEKGDRLEYDIFMPALNPLLKGGVDIEVVHKDLPAALGGKPWFRDTHTKDAKDLTCHGDAILEPARDVWYHRSFDLSALAGTTAERFTLVFEGDAPGRYVQLVDNIRVTRDGRTVLSVWEDGPAPEWSLRQCDGFSRTVLVTTAPRSARMDDAGLKAVLERARAQNEMRLAREQFRSEMEVARDLAEHLGDPKLIEEIAAAGQDEDTRAYDAGDAAAYLESLHRARHRLGHAHPVMEKFTGHLVGHAHIDLQWLWTWDDCVDNVIPQTFGQALKFMKEFPEFTFSQSSPALYLATEQHHPDLFRQIQERVAAGQWELVGGRWCEGDTNMISPESHVRHLLYGQRYFQQNFGRMCTVGWEPDTFGHAWTMPQILRKGGIDSYYFCRAGKGVPLFWWEGPDGSKVLAFEEPATGGWYNDSVDDSKVKELAKFVKGTRAWDHLMVYGVGNHGGGPTREHIQAALEMRRRGLWPGIKFSTATEFFKRLHEQAAQLSAPTIRDELNPVFDGCYTSHSRIKKYNRDSESLLESAEAFAALAALDGGPAYPRESFEAMWRDVLWNHHHDTLPGSFIHPSALYSERMYQSLLERGHAILARSQAALTAGLAAEYGPDLVVFNPLAWERTDAVEATVTLSARKRLTVLFDEQGDVPTQVTAARIDGDVVTLRICFLARNVPACGYKVFRNRGPASATPTPVTADNLREIYACVVDSPALAADAPAASHMQMLHEKPHGMSAWVIGEIDQTETLGTPISTEVVDQGPVRRNTRRIWRWGKSTVTEDRLEYAHTARVDYVTTVDWGELGNSREGSPMLKVAFDAGVKADQADFDIPFGDIARKADGREVPALKWCSLTGLDADGKTRGLTVLNDCKHGYDVKDGVIRLTLLRASYDPDPTPDIGTHAMRYATLAHGGPLDRAAVVRAGWEFNKPLSARTVGPSDATAFAAAPPARAASPAGAAGMASHAGAAGGASGDTGAAARWSGCSVQPANVIVTALKQAEDGEGLILRAYECAGRETPARFDLGFNIQAAWETDLLERNQGEVALAASSPRTVAVTLKPYEICTLRIRPAAPSR